MLTACLVFAGHILIGDAHFTEMYAMDFPSDSVLMSHMGEGNWKIARKDRPVRLISARSASAGWVTLRPSCSSTSPARHAGHAGIAERAFRSCGRGENLDSQELPALEMPYGSSGPPRDCARA